MSSPQWPSIFDALRRQLGSTGEYRRIFEALTKEFPQGRCTRLLCAGLLDSTEADSLPDDAEFGFDVDSNSPEESADSDDAVEPAFWIWSKSTQNHRIEPLVLSWISNEKRVSQLDPGFLLTQKLCPRLIAGGTTIEWDKPDLPESSVACGVPVGEQENLEESESHWDVKFSYLQDYASLRGKSILVSFFELWRLPEFHSLRSELGGRADRMIRSKGFSLRYHLEPNRSGTGTLFVELRGFNLLVRPGPTPISSDDYGELTWPGIVEPIREEGNRINVPLWDFVFVRDQVLEEFEDNPHYSISPASGAIALGNQWAVGYCERYGRDLIRLEIRKLYEGVPAWVVRHYHRFSVERPDGEPVEMLAASNVATRSRRICYAYLDLGDALSRLLSLVGAEQQPPQAIIQLARRRMDYAGWWTDAEFARLSRHCRRNVKEDAFLSRAKNLFRATIERMNSSILRQLLKKLRFPQKELKNLGSIESLVRVVELCRAITENGYALPTDAKRARLQQAKTAPTRRHLASLKALHALRLLDAHLQGSNKLRKMDQALAELGIDPMSVGGGYGLAMDMLMDQVAEAFESATREINNCAQYSHEQLESKKSATTKVRVRDIRSVPRKRRTAREK